MGSLRNEKHERFCCAIIFDDTHPRDAYVVAGFEPNRANHNKLLRRPDVKGRLEELRGERETRDKAARMPLKDVLVELSGHGIANVADFFRIGPSGALAVRDLRAIRAEAALALLQALQEGLGMDSRESPPT
jgi:hypothetical protein